MPKKPLRLLVIGALLLLGCGDDGTGSSNGPVIQDQFWAQLTYEPYNEETVPGPILFQDIELVATNDLRPDIAEGVSVCSDPEEPPCCSSPALNGNRLFFDSCYLQGGSGTNHEETIGFLTNSDNPIQSFAVTLRVPSGPPEPTSACAYTWPGLQPIANLDNTPPTFGPIGNGVLQPVLTYGTTCQAPNPNGVDRSNSWWISGQYVNTLGVDGEYSPGCGAAPSDPASWKGGDTVLLDFNELVQTKMELIEGSGWVQTITRTGQTSVDWCLELAPGNPGCPQC